MKYVDALSIMEENTFEQHLQFDKHHKNPKKIGDSFGDFVMIWNDDVTAGVNKKLLPKYRGPYEVKKLLGNDRYRITDIVHFQVTEKPFEGVLSSELIEFIYKTVYIK